MARRIKIAQLLVILPIIRLEGEPLERDKRKGGLFLKGLTSGVKEGMRTHLAGF